MKTRKEVVAFIEKGIGRENMVEREKGYTARFGKQDLRMLLDFIYGGEPVTEEECLESIEWRNPKREDK